jgi:hypothetical protein
VETFDPNACRLNYLSRIAIVCNTAEICILDDLTIVTNYHLCELAQHWTNMHVMEVQHVQLELRDAHCSYIHRLWLNGTCTTTRIA